jgi:hypothetical protein
VRKAALVVVGYAGLVAIHIAVLSQLVTALQQAQAQVAEQFVIMEAQLLLLYHRPLAAMSISKAD